MASLTAHPDRLVVDINQNLRRAPTAKAVDEQLRRAKALVGDRRLPDARPAHVQAAGLLARHHFYRDTGFTPWLQWLRPTHEFFGRAVHGVADRRAQCWALLSRAMVDRMVKGRESTDLQGVSAWSEERPWFILMEEANQLRYAGRRPLVALDLLSQSFDRAPALFERGVVAHYALSLGCELLERGGLYWLNADGDLETGPFIQALAEVMLPLAECASRFDAFPLLQGNYLKHLALVQAVLGQDYASTLRQAEDIMNRLDTRKGKLLVVQTEALIHWSQGDVSTALARFETMRDLGQNYYGRARRMHELYANRETCRDPAEFTDHRQPLLHTTWMVEGMREVLPEMVEGLTKNGPMSPRTTSQLVLPPKPQPKQRPPAGLDAPTLATFGLAGLGVAAAALPTLPGPGVAAGVGLAAILATTIGVALNTHRQRSIRKQP